MKRNLLFKTMSLLCALVVGTSSLWADEITFDPTTDIGTGTSVSKSGISITASSGTMENGTDYRPYSGATLSFSSTIGNITKIEFTSSGGDKAKCSSLGNPNVGSWSVTTTSGIWTGNASSITFSSSSAQVRISSIKVTTVSAYTITAISNNSTWGTVSGTTTITATPAEGYRVVAGDGGYTVTSGTATVTNNSDNTFSVTATSDCTVRINFEAIPTHNLSSAVFPVGAGTVVLGASSIMEGSTTPATATANAGYKFTGWDISGTGASLSSTTENPTTVTMGTADATVTANFEAVTTYEIKWSVNGTIVKTENVEENTPINFVDPNESEVPTGYTFTGWVTEDHKIDTPTDTDPSANYVTSGNSVENITYYAVMAVVTGSTPESWTETALSDMTASDVFVFSNGSKAMNNDGGSQYAPSQNAITVVNGEITSEVTDNLKWQVSGNSTDGYTFYPNGDDETWLYCSVTTGSNNNNIRVGTGARKLWVFTSSGYMRTNDTYTNRYLCVYDSQDFRGYTGMANAFVPKFYKYTAASATYGRFCTTVPTATITLNAACHDSNNKIYSTYSNTSSFVVPADLTVSEISVIGGELLVEPYNTGDIVPANTGVMVAADDGGNYTVYLTDAAGTSVLGDDNMLKGTSAGMTASEMATASPSCTYYRLTMHNGTTIGYFWGAANGDAFDIAANKAYLAVPTGSGAKISGFTFDDTTTGIDGINVNDYFDANAPMYNLAGQRVNKSYKGVVIQNGKKMLNK